MIPRKSPLKRSAPIARKRATPRRVREWQCQHCLTSNGGGYKKMTVCAKCHIRRATKRTTLKARCDALARALCKRLAGGMCAVEDMPLSPVPHPGSDWAHRWPRRHHSLRWSMDNCDFLCRLHHLYFTTHPAAFMSWLIDKGVDVYTLERAANSTWDKDYTRVLKYLTEYK